MLRYQTRMNLLLLKVESIFTVVSLQSVGSANTGKHSLNLTLPRCHPKGLRHLSCVWGSGLEWFSLYCHSFFCVSMHIRKC